MRGVTPSMMRDASYSSMRMGLYDLFKAQLAPSGAGKDDFHLWQKARFRLNLDLRIDSGRDGE